MSSGPLLDVTELLSDVDLTQVFDVTRWTESVDNDGINQRRQSTIRGVRGSLQPVSGSGGGQLGSASTLRRLAEGANFSSYLEIWTTFRLTNGRGSEHAGADVVVWRGARYTVVSVADWTQWGQGFIRAVAQLADNVDG